jgi:uncharacterized protein YqgC (DUF456 family)
LVYVWIALFILLILAFWMSNLFGLPGNWFMILAVIVWIWLGPKHEPHNLGWYLVLTLVILATVGEIMEFGASVVGTSKLGGSKIGATASLVGSILGGIAGALFGLPIPVVGWVVGSVLFACIGAMVGATLGEKWTGKPLSSSLKIGGAAFFGRMLGTVGKITLGSVMAAVAILGLFL